MLADARSYRVDVGLCNDHAFLLWAGIGLDAMIIHQLEPRPRAEKYVSVPQYVAAMAWNATIWHGMDLRVWADDQRVDGHFLLAVDHQHPPIRRRPRRPFAGCVSGRRRNGPMAVERQQPRRCDPRLFEVLAGIHVTSDQARRLPFRSARGGIGHRLLRSHGWRADAGGKQVGLDDRKTGIEGAGSAQSDEVA